MKSLRLLFIIIFSVGIYSLSSAQVPTLIPFNNQQLFVSGSNVAWINFAGDIGPGNTEFDQFESIFKELNENGGNSMRLWLHTTGGTTPAWNGSDVVGPGNGTIEDLKTILDSAEKYDIGLVLTLWSFDMLRTSNGSTIVNRSKAILTDSVKTQTYIDNSLIPMVTALKDHKAVLAWEVFNEPEGMSNQFGWDGITKVDMSDIQAFVNRVAGAIHRIDKNIKVTNGAWSFKSLSDRFGSAGVDMNYYRNDRLFEAGSDSLGYLDFYTVHYYTWAGTALSPFHNNVEYWGLDKPVIVAEFYAKEPVFSVPVNKLFETLYDRGYAGALSWQWVDFAQKREGNESSWPNTLMNTKQLEVLHPESVVVALNGAKIEFNSDFLQIAEGEDVTLSWKVRGAVQRSLNGVAIPKDSSQKFTLMENARFVLKVILPSGLADSSVINVDVVSPKNINRSYQQISESSTSLVTELTDNDLETEWTGNVSKDYWLQVDLNKSIELYRVILNWGLNFTNEFSMATSLDGVKWEETTYTGNIDGNADTLTVEIEKSARFVRLNFTSTNETEIQLKEFQTFGLISENQPPKISLTKPLNNEKVEGLLDYYVKFEVEQGTDAIERYVLIVNEDSVAGKSTSPYQFVYKPTEGLNTIQIKAILADKIIYSKPITAEFVKAPEKRRFEAESGILTGDTSVLSTVAGSSSGKFVYVQSSGTISWPFIFIRTAGTYKIKFGYYLPFDFKKQYLNVNSERIEEVAFDLPVTTWLETQEFEVQLVVGNNSIEIEKSWGYMYLDYLDIIGDGQTTVSNEEFLQDKIEFGLKQNYPNPFNPSTIIEFSLDKTSMVQLSIFDVTGRKIAQLIDSPLSQGVHKATFEASSIASGLYIIQLRAGDRVQVSKMMLIK